MLSACLLFGSQQDLPAVLAAADVFSQLCSPGGKAVRRVVIFNSSDAKTIAQQLGTISTGLQWLGMCCPAALPGQDALMMPV